jgi:DNA-binding MarR family transcriptional regulator
MAGGRPPDIPRTEDRPNQGKLLARPYLALSAALDQRLAAAGYADVRAAHGVVFAVIDAEGTRVTDLAARAGMTKQAMAELVEHLEARGYVQREPDPADRRARLVRLTRRGWECIAAGRAIATELEDELAARWGAEPMAVLRVHLATLGELLAPDRSRTPAPPA